MSHFEEIDFNNAQYRAKQLQILRAPFPDHQISKLPKSTIKAEEYKKLTRSKCDVCGGFHPKDKTIHLDYVGHAALTDRLLETDPFWTWEPLSYTDKGLPLLDETGGLWIKLTLCGVTRLGYGNAKENSYADVGSRQKEVIGDALRNAAMRFGAALELWHKGVLHLEEEDEKISTTLITPDPVNQETVSKAVFYLKAKIDMDTIEDTWQQVQTAYSRLSSNEIMAVDALLKDKAPNSNRSYRNILKDYLAHKPTDAEFSA